MATFPTPIQPTNQPAKLIGYFLSDVSSLTPFPPCIHDGLAVRARTRARLSRRWRFLPAGVIYRVPFGPSFGRTPDAPATVLPFKHLT
ncbi:hypothetical protein FEMY_22210 [Ferrovum myxofaciens]|uniref:Uncharacterized protein n=1 Tax=Ferrovum myxofaciens TaxID=416213 RepID=A0A149VVL3_9PROT|nr:hypothetical protein FEMY_22210 [Ferrovum myxofaciens]